MHTFSAQPQRPQTAKRLGVQKASKEQADLLRAMMHIKDKAEDKMVKKVQFVRPRTAATTNKYDESRIKDKLRALERLEDSLTYDIDKVANEIDLFTMVREAESYAENPGRENG